MTTEDHRRTANCPMTEQFNQLSDLLWEVQWSVVVRHLGTKSRGDTSEWAR